MYISKFVDLSNGIFIIEIKLLLVIVNNEKKYINNIIYNLFIIHYT